MSGFRGVLGPTCYSWRSSTNLSAAGYCSAGTWWSWVQIKVLCYNPVTFLSTWHYGNRVYSPNVITNYTCPNGQYLLNDGTGSYALTKGA